MPLLNICGATGNDMTPQLSHIFEWRMEEDYKKFKEILAQFDISYPKANLVSEGSCVPRVDGPVVQGPAV